MSWNVTVDATGEQGFPEAGAGKFINVTVPVDWQNTTTGSLNSTGHIDRQYLSPAPSLLFEATNGTWTILCGGPNVMERIEVYSLHPGWSPVKVDGAVVGDNLTVKGFVTSGMSGTAKLTVVRNGKEVFTNQTGFSGGVAELGWHGCQKVSEAGSYKLVFFVECGLEVGLLEEDFQVSEKAPCSIQTKILETVGRVKVAVNVSRSDTGFPIVGASVNVYYTNGSRIEASVIDYHNGSYLVVFTPPSEGRCDFTITVEGSHILSTSETLSVYYEPTPPLSRSNDGLSLALILQSVESAQSVRMFSILGAASIAAAAGGISGSRAYRRWRVPVRAISTIENVLVSHKETGLLLWSFDVLLLDVDESLISGFISTIRSFAEKMKIGRFNTLETSLGTLIKVEGEFIEAVCITGLVIKPEVERIRKRLKETLMLVEAEAGTALKKWKGRKNRSLQGNYRPRLRQVLQPLQAPHNPRKEKSKTHQRKTAPNKNLKSIEETLEEPELSYEKQLIEQRLAIINNTLAKIKPEEPAKPTKTRKEIEEMRDELEKLKGELEKLKKKDKQKQQKLETVKKQSQHKDIKLTK